jgi:hypothetical protein
MSTFKRLIPLALGLSLSLAALSAVPAAHAQNGVTFGITSDGSLSASLANISLTPLAFAYTEQAQTGDMTLSAIDTTGLGNGWNVTIRSSNLTYTGQSASAADVPLLAENLLIGTPVAPTLVVGMPVSAEFGPKLVAGGTLDTARKVIQSTVGHGLGEYTQGLPLNLTVPAYTRTGSYSGTLTVTITEGP